MLQLANETPFISTLNLLADVEGIDTLYVVVKATFVLGYELALAEEQTPIHMADEYFGDPGESSLKYASDLHLTKPSTDVALVGSAHGPRGKPIDELMTKLSVGELKKQIKVVGDHQWTGRAVGPSKTAPGPFLSMPLTYERAFGGVHVRDAEKGKVEFEAANPVGQGFHARKRRKEIKGLPAPNLLDPDDSERPACYGFVAPNWTPRADHAGTYDEAWERNRSPFLPTDFDSRFFNAAHPDLISDRYLRGGESVELQNLSRFGTLRFPLPRCSFDVTVRVDGQEENPLINLETVLFEPDDDRLTMLWRAAMPCDKRALKVEKVRVGLEELVLNGRLVEP